MPWLVATRELKYAGRTIMPGQEFEATDKDAKALKAIRKAEDAKPLPKPKEEIQQKVLEPEPEPEPKPRSYRRRDMRAEED